MNITRRHRNERIAAAVLIAVLAAGAYGFIRWNEAEERAMRADVRYIPKTNTVTAEVLLLRDYVRIDSSKPPGIAAGARWLAAQLEERGVRAELIESAPDHLNVYARIKGKKPGGGLLLFNHIDVMPPGDGWMHPPFEGVMSGNEMYGRGALDMKSLAICQLLAFAEIARSGRAPEHDLVFLATAEEEQGSERGMKWLVQHRPDIFAGIAYGISEGGLTEVMTENMSYFGIEVGGKQVVRTLLTAKDADTLQRARLALEPYIGGLREPHRILPEVRTFFRQLAPTRVALRGHLADIDATVARGDFWELPPSYRDLTQNTLWVSGPFLRLGRWTAAALLINLPDEIPANRVAWLRERVEPFGIAIEVQSSDGPVPMSTSDTALFRILSDEARRRYRVDAGVQVLYKNVSDARVLRPRGIICYGISPYPVNYFQSLSIHSKNERIRLDWFVEGVGYTRNVVRAWAYGPATTE